MCVLTANHSEPVSIAALSNALTARVAVRPRSRLLAHLEGLGATFWLRLKKLVGSYLVLSSTSRA